MASNRKPTFARTLSEMDPNVSGSTDLAGEPKEKIPHQRASDKKPLLERYDIGSLIGQGAFGKVCLGTEKSTGLQFAIKLIKKKIGHKSMMEQLQREVLILKKVYHSNIIKLKEVFETPDKLYFIMEYCEGGDLIKSVRRNQGHSEKDCKETVARLAHALAYLHDFGVVHRDLKPENILLRYDDPTRASDIRVSDFGLVTFADNCAMIDSTAGTPFYMAPEIFTGNSYSQQCDIWSLGMITYLLLCHFTEDSEKMLLDMINRKKIEFPMRFFEHVNPMAVNLVDMMLQFDPAQRVTAREIMRHPWLQETEALSAQRQSLSDGNLGFQPTVLKMMRAYNAERRLKKGMLVVLAAVRWHRATFKNQPLSALTSSALVSEPSLSGSHHRITKTQSSFSVDSKGEGSTHNLGITNRRRSTSSSDISSKSSGSSPRASISMHFDASLGVINEQTSSAAANMNSNSETSPKLPHIKTKHTNTSLANAHKMSTSSGEIYEQRRGRSGTVPESQALNKPQIKRRGTTNSNSSVSGRNTATGPSATGSTPTSKRSSNIPPIASPLEGSKSSSRRSSKEHLAGYSQTSSTTVSPSLRRRVEVNLVSHSSVLKNERPQGIPELTRGLSNRSIGSSSDISKPASDAGTIYAIPLPRISNVNNDSIVAQTSASSPNSKVIPRKGAAVTASGFPYAKVLDGGVKRMSLGSSSAANSTSVDNSK